jgi:hypothetical protein
MRNNKPSPVNKHLKTKSKINEIQLYIYINKIRGI